MTYNVFGGTLNPTQSFDTIPACVWRTDGQTDGRNCCT